MPARTQNVSNMCWPNPSSVSEHTKCISTYVDQTSLMLAWTLNASQHVLNKPRPCQPKHKMYLNLCWSVPSHAYEEIKCKSTYLEQTYPNAREDTKFTSTCADQTPPMPARSRNVSQLLLTSSLPRQRRHKIYLNICWTNPSHAARSHNVSHMCWKAPPVLARKQNTNPHMLTKPIPFQRGHKIYLHLCWPYTSNASEVTKCFSTCVD